MKKFILAIVLLSFSLETYSFSFTRNIKQNKEPKLSIKFLGNTSIYFQDLGKQKHSIFIDAFVSRPGWNPIIFGKLQHNYKNDENQIFEILNDADISKIDIIVPLHSHFDHLLDAPYIASKKGSRLVSSKTTKKISESMNFDLKFINHKFEGAVDENEFFKITLEKAIHSNTAPWSDLTAPLRIRNKKNKDVSFQFPQRSRNYIEGQSINVHILHKSTNKKIYILGGLPKDYCDYNILPKTLLNSDILFVSVPIIKSLKNLKKHNCGSKKNQIDNFWAALRLAPKTVIPVHWDSFATKLNKDKCDSDINICLKPLFLLKPTMLKIDNDLNTERNRNLKLFWLTAFGEISL